MGGLLNLMYGYNTVPSPINPGPLNGNYYNGGYITKTHGSYYNAGLPLNAIQIEVPSSLRQIDTVDEFARNLAYSVFEFYYLHSFNV